MTAVIPENIDNPEFEEFDDVSVYSPDLAEIWLGRIRSIPNVTDNSKATAIVCEGYQNHMKDTRFKRHYSDGGYSHWDLTPPVAFGKVRVWEHAHRDHNNRIFIRLPEGVPTQAGMITGVYYRPANIDKISQNLFTLTFDWETGAGYDPANSEFRLVSFVSDVTLGTATVEWNQGVAGAQSGSETITITGSKKGLQFYMFGVLAETPADETNWGEVTNIRVNGLNGFEAGDSYKADDVIKNFLSVSESLSTDVTQIDAGTFTITDLVLDQDVTPYQALNEVNKYEGYIWTFDRDSSNNPRLIYQAHDAATIHYTTTLQAANLKLAGRSIADQYNQVDVEYNDSDGKVLVENRTSAHTLLDTLGITRKARIRVNTTSQTHAQQAGDTFLTDKARPQGKGTLTIKGTVQDINAIDIPVYSLKPGRNILIRDLDPAPGDFDTFTSANVLNGKNCFRIVRVTYDGIKDTVALELDNDGDHLDLLLAKKGQD
jgi:hypothetical protein